MCDYKCVRLISQAPILKFKLMYSTKNAITMSLKDILGKLSDYDIYAYYMGKFQVGKLYNSPLRSTDKIPSFAVFLSRNHDLLFKDHGSGQSGNAITFCKLISGVKTREELEKELLKIIQNDKSYKILLDIKGEEVSSIEFSTLINDKLTHFSSITFIIGSSNGVSENIKNFVNQRISFGKITMPHGLFRAVLLEQIYRSFKILNNESYHK